MDAVNRAPASGGRVALEGGGVTALGAFVAEVVSDKLPAYPSAGLAAAFVGGALLLAGLRGARNWAAATKSPFWTAALGVKVAPK